MASHTLPFNRDEINNDVKPGSHLLYARQGIEPTTVHVKKPRKIKVNCRRETVEWLGAEAQLGARLVLPHRGRSVGAHSRRLSPATGCWAQGLWLPFPGGHFSEALGQSVGDWAGGHL